MGFFARALALRYGGTFAALPRVRYFEVWDEPNLSQYLSPQFEGGKLVAADVYRDLVNSFARAVHEVHADNVVVAGSLSAFRFLTPYGRLGIAPLQFMRRMLCMSAGRAPRATCNTTVHFDAFSIHPWTSGGPTHHASEKDDVSLGDLPELRRLLAAAVKAGHIRESETGLWVTEFAWDMRPPDTHPQTAPMALQSRWVAEAVYQAWKNDVRVFTWFLLWDQLYPWDSLQSGLFFRNGEDFRFAQPKPTSTPFASLSSPTARAAASRSGGRRRTKRPTGWRYSNDRRRAGAGWGRSARQERDLPGVGALPEAGGIHRAAARPASAAQTYRDAVVSAKPMSYWPLGDRGTTTASDAMHNNDGAYTNGVRLGVKGPLPRTTAVLFNGKTARVKLGVVSSLHTVELWLKTRTKADAVAFSNRNAIHQFSTLGTYGGLAHSFDAYGVIGAPVGNGTWHHLVYTYDSASSTGRLYIDGKLSQFAVYQRAEGGAPASIGYDADLKQYFSGQIAQVAVYSYVLSPEQVRAHYVASGRRVAASVPPGMLRAVDLSTGAASLPFSLVRPHDRYVLPFGGGGVPTAPPP